MTNETLKENGYEILAEFTMAKTVKKGTKAIIVKKDNKYFVMDSLKEKK